MSKIRYTVDLIKQMAECDANYIRLLKLVPALSGYRDGGLEEPTVLHTRDPHPSSLQRTEAQDAENALEGRTIEFCVSEHLGINSRVTVEIKILEAFRYTSTLQITQKPELKKWMTNPSMIVRVYHDAHTAEVVCYQGHRNLKPHYPQPNPKMYHADEKMQVNQFLGEWLTHCLEVGRSTKAPDLSYSS